MTKKPKAHMRLMPTLAKDSVRLPPSLPDAQSVLELDFKLTPDELTVIKTAMAIHSASKQPKITWIGWKHLAIAIAIGSEHAKHKAKTTNLKDYQYRVIMGQFLRKTGFIFVNKVDRSYAVRMLEIWDDVDNWRSKLTTSRRAALNNPRDIWDEYHKDLKASDDPEAKLHPVSSGKRRSLPSLLEQVTALEEACAAAEERRDRAEHEADYFAELANEIATRAKMSDQEIANIRTEVRANRSWFEEEPGEDDA